MSSLSRAPHPPEVMGRLAHYDALWKARRAGIEPLKSALRESLGPDLPVNRDRLVNAPDFRPAAISDLYGKYRDLIPFPPDVRAARQVLRRRERTCYGLGIVAGITSFLGAYEMTRSNAAGVAFCVLPTMVTGGSALFLIGEIPKLQSQVIAKAREAVLHVPDSDLLLRCLAAALLVPEEGEEIRDFELRHFAWAADSIYRKQVESPPGLLARIAMVRGSHYAAHALWLMHQEEGLGETPLKQWAYDENIVRLAVENNYAPAIETLDLAVRESARFRRRFLQEVPKLQFPYGESPTVKVARELEG